MIKKIYKQISSKLDEIIETVEYGTTVNDINTIIENLRKLLIRYSLEDMILNNKDFAECFFGKVVKVNEYYTRRNVFEKEEDEVNIIYIDFVDEIVEWLSKCNDRQKDIIIQNLQAKLEHYKTDFSDLPF